MKKHLIFHFCCNENYFFHKAFQKLRENIELFDGYKIITITDIHNNLVNNYLIDAVLKEFSSEKTLFHIVENDPNSREVKPFFDLSLPQMKLLCEDDDYIFYGHAKGVSRNQNDYAINAWVDTLWKYNVEKFDEYIFPHLGKYKTLGCLRKVKEKAGVYVKDGVIETFHFSGTFFWFSSKIFQSDWNDPTRHHMSVIERWPGLISNLSNSFSAFDLGDSLEYYNPQFWIDKGL